MVTLVKPLHPQNAPLPMIVTLLGIVTLFRFLHLSNDHLPMAVTV